MVGDFFLCKYRISLKSHKFDALSCRTIFCVATSTDSLERAHSFFLFCLHEKFTVVVYNYSHIFTLEFKENAYFFSLFGSSFVLLAQQEVVGVLFDAICKVPFDRSWTEQPTLWIHSEMNRENIENLHHFDFGNKCDEKRGRQISGDGKKHAHEQINLIKPRESQKVTLFVVDIAGCVSSQKGDAEL